MRNNIAPGSDGIHVELIKAGSSILKDDMLSILSKVWNEGSVSQAWGRSIIILIYKGKRDCGSYVWYYRGISVINHIDKLHERIVKKRARMIIEQKLGGE